MGKRYTAQGGNPTTGLQGHFSSPKPTADTVLLDPTTSDTAKAVDVLTVHQPWNQRSREVPFPGTHVIRCNVDHPQRSDKLTEFYSFQVEQGFPGGPVVESVLPLQGHSFKPWWGTKIPHAIKQNKTKPKTVSHTHFLSLQNADDQVPMWLRW